MTTLADICDPNLVAKMVAEGFIRANRHNALPLRVLNYTERAQYGREWNEATINCRGLIVDDDDIVIARGFPKFWNLGEHEPDDPRLTGPFTVAEKLDGSLGIIYEYDGQTAVATRGSFHSEQAEWATGWLLRSHPNGLDDPGMTTLVEIIYPANRIVLDYGERAELVHLTSLDTATGRPVSDPIAAWNLTTARAYDPADLTAHDVRQLDPTGEGFVLYFTETNTRVKVKHDEYVRLHRLLTSTSNRTVWEALRAGEDPERIAEAVPDEFHAWLRQTVSGFRYSHDALVSEARAEFAAIGPAEDRKAFAAIACRSPLRGFLFALYDDKDITDAAWKTLRPEYARPYVDDIG